MQAAASLVWQNQSHSCFQIASRLLPDSCIEPNKYHQHRTTTNSTHSARSTSSWSLVDSCQPISASRFLPVDSRLSIPGSRLLPVDSRQSILACRFPPVDSCQSISTCRLNLFPSINICPSFLACTSQSLFAGRHLLAVLPAFMSTRPSELTLSLQAFHHPVTPITICQRLTVLDFPTFSLQGQIMSSIFCNDIWDATRSLDAAQRNRQ
jgi:hypothetical protein